MPASVPAVIPLEEIKWQLAKLLELSIERTKLDGDWSFYKRAVRDIRFFYEAKFKEAANLGNMDRGFLDQIRKAIERAEAIADRH